MCRLSGIVTDPGAPPLPLSTLLTDPPFSLAYQSYRPTRMPDGAVNVDGAGIAWYADDAPEPLRYGTDKPIWGDANLPFLAPRIRAGVQLAAVRWASPGIPFGNAYVAPFLHGSLAAVHNGYLRSFRHRPGRELLSRLPDDLFAAYHAASDSLAIFLTIVHRLRDDPDGGLALAVGDGVAEVAELARAHGVAAALNVSVSDGQRIVTTRGSVESPANSLVVLDHGERWPDAIVVASEPLDDDPGWEDVPPASLVELADGKITISALAGVDPAP